MPPSLSLVWTDLHAFDPARLVAPLSAVGQGKIGRLWRCLCTIHLSSVSDRHNGLGQTRPCRVSDAQHSDPQPLIRFPQVHLKMSSIWVRAEVRVVVVRMPRCVAHVVMGDEGTAPTKSSLSRRDTQKQWRRVGTKAWQLRRGTRDRSRDPPISENIVGRILKLSSNHGWRRGLMALRSPWCIFEVVFNLRTPVVERC